LAPRDRRGSPGAACRAGTRARIGIGFVLTDEDNVAANALYHSAGGTSAADVIWTFSYGDD
jgi:hypothetical protein